MKAIKSKVIVLLMTCFSVSLLQGQESIAGAGNNAIGSEGMVSYTVGQLVYTTNTGTNGNAVQGVQQPYEITLVSGIEMARGVSLQCNVFPNPAANFLSVEIKDFESKTLGYQISNINGEILAKENITSNATTIFIENYVPAIYILKIMDNKVVIKTFKILKIH